MMEDGTTRDRSDDTHTAQLSTAQPEPPPVDVDTQPYTSASCRGMGDRLENAKSVADLVGFDGVRVPVGCTVVTRQFKQHYVDHRELPSSINGVSLVGICFICSDEIKDHTRSYSEFNMLMVCDGCNRKIDTDEHRLGIIPDSAHNMIDEWLGYLPILRDCQHNMVLMNVDRRYALSAHLDIGMSSHSVLILPKEVRGKAILNELNRRGRTYRANWNFDNAKNTPIRQLMMHIHGLSDPLLQQVARPTSTAVDDYDGTDDDDDDRDGDGDGDGDARVEPGTDSVDEANETDSGQIST